MSTAREAVTTYESAGVSFVGKRTLTTNTSEFTRCIQRRDSRKGADPGAKMEPSRYVANLRKGGQPHGTASRYQNQRCRCDECKKAWAAYHLAYLYRSGRVKRTMEEHRAFLREQAEARDNHGTETRYRRCKCDKCREASSAARKKRREKAKAVESK